MNRPIISALATTALVVFSQPATAQTKQMTISYGDLDVHNEAGARILLNRLRMAARIVCEPVPVFRDFSDRHFYDACRKNALDSAVAAVGAPEVVEIYRGGAAETRTADRR